MKVVTDAGLQGDDPTVFTENVLEIAVPKGNPARSRAWRTSRNRT